MSCSKTQRNDASEAQTRGPSVLNQAFYHLAPTCQCSSLVSQPKKSLLPTSFGNVLALCILGNISRLIWMNVWVFCGLSIFLAFFKFLRKPIRVPNDLTLDQAPCFGRPVLGLNCLQNYQQRMSRSSLK